MFDQEEALMSKQGGRVETANGAEVRAGSWRAAIHMPNRNAAERVLISKK